MVGGGADEDIDVVDDGNEHLEGGEGGGIFERSVGEREWEEREKKEREKKKRKEKERKKERKKRKKKGGGT